jgi:hypothetical protein
LRDDDFMAHDVPNHPERPARIRALEAEMSANEWFGAARVQADEVARELLLPVHPEAHIAGLEAAGRASAEEAQALRQFVREGYLTLENVVQPDSGELVVFPGSHRERRVYTQSAALPKVVDEDWTEFGEKVVPIWTEMLEKGQYRREIYRPKAGTILIWHENLMHAGSPRRDREKSRRSIVGHYFAHGAVVYYDSSGMPGIVQEAQAPVAAE